MTSPFVENVTRSPPTGLLFPSTTVALTSRLDAPSAGTVLGFIVSVTVAATWAGGTDAPATVCSE